MELWRGLSLFLKVSSKDAVQNILQEAYCHRHGSDTSAVPDVVVAATAKAQRLEPLETRELFSSACMLVSRVLQTGAVDVDSISRLFPDDFHKDLKGLLSEVINQRVQDWRRHILAQQVSLPRLESFDWRVDVKTSSTCVARMAMPTCLLQMKVHGEQDSTLLHTVSVEFSTETLNTMLDGLGKIRDQLASVASK